MSRKGGVGHVGKNTGRKKILASPGSNLDTSAGIMTSRYAGDGDILASHPSRSSDDPIWDCARSHLLPPGYMQLTVYDPLVGCQVGRLEHIVVWERYHSETVPEGWVIHHADERKNNNSPENLVALPRGLHRELHWMLQREKGKPDFHLRRRQLTETIIRRSTALADLRCRWRQEEIGDGNDQQP